MKKIYTKPSLHAEKFAVEGIMTDLPETLSTIRALYLGNEVQGSISFTDANTLNSVSYKEFVL